MAPVFTLYNKLIRYRIHRKDGQNLNDLYQCCQLEEICPFSANFFNQESSIFLFEKVRF